MGWTDLLIGLSPLILAFIISRLGRGPLTPPEEHWGREPRHTWSCPVFHNSVNRTARQVTCLSTGLWAQRTLHLRSGC